ncbi:MAG: threonine synthase [Chloroflexi bacterium]|nr:threonine synthase [Chloroflexota bacterium]
MTSNLAITLRCVLCGAQYTPGEVDYVCPKHGNDGILDVQYDYDELRRRVRRQTLADDRYAPSLWRYRRLLPLDPRTLDEVLAGDTPLNDVGWTPLFRASRLAASLGLRHLHLKDDTRQPTASFKDRASALAVVKAREAEAAVITTASSGNAAAALSGMAACVGLPNVIFVPASAPPAKVAQLLIFGSTVFLVEGTYDQAFDLCIEASHEFGWYCRNTAYNPYMTEGKKTVSFEIAEQLGWQSPDCVFVPVGDGCIIGGVHKGFRDLLALGWIERMPRLVGVQAEGAAALVHAWQRGSDEVVPVEAQTLADSISVGLPRDRVKALRAVRETGGTFLAVSDDEILAAMRLLAREAGIFAEPAGATGFAGLQKALSEGLVNPDEHVVVLVTGNGLKDVESAMKATGQATRIAPSLRAVKEALVGEPLA